MSKKQTVSFETNASHSLGEINVTTGVLEDIAAKAASEIKGVLTRQLKIEAGKLFRFQSTGVTAKMQQDSGRIIIDINVSVAYGCNVPIVAAAIQDKVKEQILFMTDLVVSEVNVHVQSIETEAPTSTEISVSEWELTTGSGE